MSKQNTFGALGTLQTKDSTVSIYRLAELAKSAPSVDRLPVSIKILLENLLRHCDGRTATEWDVRRLAAWNSQGGEHEIGFTPARVILQDFTGVPCVADLAAMRAVMERAGRDPARINPIVPVDLVIDHSVQVDAFGSPDAFRKNVGLEFERNRERYEFLRWAQRAFRNFSVVPPGTGIVHQVNLEHLAKVVQTQAADGRVTAFPDTLVGTDSHTTMINGLGVLGWGVGGIEAEACMLGQPLYMLVPEVIGVQLRGALPEGATATDLVLTVTELLRKKGVVGKFVEFCGPGLSALSLPDRATLANMAPEYGATMGFFPVDDETLRYLRLTGRDDGVVDLVERYCKEQGLFRTAASPDPVFTEMIELDLSRIEPSIAGPRRPQDRVRLLDAPKEFDEVLHGYFKAPPGRRAVDVRFNGGHEKISDGTVVIAAITSCTNTSNPSVLIGAGLLAKKARERGLTAKPYVKTSLAPGSRVVTDYLTESGLMKYLEELNFHLVGYGCTTCIGNSGPLLEAVDAAIREKNLVAVAVLSGNRNFEGRINPSVKASYLASPPLVVAYALAGSVDVNLATDPLGAGNDGRPVFLKDIWPTAAEIRETMSRVVTARAFRTRYAQVFEGDDSWRNLPVPAGDLYPWVAASTYIQEPPFFLDVDLNPKSKIQNLKSNIISGARVLVMRGDSVTTDHISPAGSIKSDSPAGRFLIDHGVAQKDFNSYGARRGNHEVMIRGTFANIRLKNMLVAGTDGGWTLHLPDGEKMTIYDAAMRYQKEGTPLVVIAGKEYGSGSSRDWAAKGTMLLGVKAVIAESYERIHRSNLVGMGVLPLQFIPGQSRETLKLSGQETYDIEGVSDNLRPKAKLTIRARATDGHVTVFDAIARLDGSIDIEYYINGGILQTVLRQLIHNT